MIIIAVENKNKEDGILLYDVCEYYGGDMADNRKLGMQDDIVNTVVLMSYHLTGINVII